MAHLKLVKEFPAMKPQFTFRSMSYEEFQNTWSEPIDTVCRVIIGLTEDMAMFQAMGLHKRHDIASKEFLRSLVYYSEVLVLDSLVKIKGGRRRFCPPTSSLPRSETTQSIDSKLTDAQLAFNRFAALKEDVLATAGWNFDWKAPKAGDKVPTASPYQLLYQLICLDRMASAPPDQTTRDLLSSLDMQGNLSLPRLSKSIQRVTFVDCGRPTMLFVAATEDRSRVVFGANQTSWGRLPAVHAITRKARDIRLREYIPLALRAFQALRRKEKKELDYLQRDQGTRALGKKELRYRSRLAAIRQMGFDESFLGGGNEMGIALRPPNWAFNQPCYACQGMMGYRSPNKPLDEKQRKSYILQFD